MFKVIIDIVGLKSTILVTVFYLLHLFFVSPPTLLLLPSLVSVFFFWLHWVFVAVCGFSLVAVSGGHSSLRCAGFSLWWLLSLQSTGSRSRGSVVVAHRL